MIKAMAFDYDGVLVDIGTHTEARMDACAEFAASTGDERFIADISIHNQAHLHGSHPAAIIGWFLQRQGLIEADIDPSLAPLTKEAEALKRELYLAKITHGLDALAGSLACVGWASEKFGPGRIAIVTTAAQNQVRPFINRHGIGELIGVVITEEDTPSDMLKPHPYAYTKAAQRFDLEPGECAALEDSVRGLQSARSAGFVALGITTTHTADQLGDSSDFVAHNFDQIPQIVENI